MWDLNEPGSSHPSAAVKRWHGGNTSEPRDLTVSERSSMTHEVRSAQGMTNVTHWPIFENYFPLLLAEAVCCNPALSLPGFTGCPPPTQHRGSASSEPGPTARCPAPSSQGQPKPPPAGRSTRNGQAAHKPGNPREQAPGRNSREAYRHFGKAPLGSWARRALAEPGAKHPGEEQNEGGDSPARPSRGRDANERAQIHSKQHFRPDSTTASAC